jgi:flavin reductase (DIM6/NTAB) family NADH-FMN oxidoreductase RutF
MEESRPDLVPLPLVAPLWERFFTVASLVLVATVDAEGTPDIAPKHMAMPLGWESWFCFVCSPRHTTYTNTVEAGAFTVGYPGPELLVEASLSASPREQDASKPALAALDTVPATTVAGILVAGCHVHLECELDRVLDGFGENSLVIGRVVAALATREAMRGFERDDAELVQDRPLLAYVHPGRFSTIRETDGFPFPAGFSI